MHVNYNLKDMSTSIYLQRKRIEMKALTALCHAPRKQHQNIIPSENGVECKVKKEETCSRSC